MSRCSGHCCKRFTLPHDYETMKRAYEHWYAGHGDFIGMSHGKLRPSDHPTKYNMMDIHLIYPMLIPLGTLKETAEGDPTENENHLYTCKHYDTNTGNCTIYEHRPSMCRDYPYKRACNYKSCTWEGHRLSDQPKDFGSDEKMKYEAGYESR